MKVGFTTRGHAPIVERYVAAMIERAGHEPDAVEPDVWLSHCMFGVNARPTSAPAIRWWTGSDVLAAREGLTVSRATAREWNMAGATWLRDELAELGVAAQVVPIVPDCLAGSRPRPRGRRPVVLATAHDGRDHIYRWEDLLTLARACPELDFRVLRRHRKQGEELPVNVECVGGWLPAETMWCEYGRASVLLRLVAHDGMSLSVLEAMARGVPVLWSYPLPGCDSEWSSIEDVPARLRELAGLGIDEGLVGRFVELRDRADAALGDAVDHAYLLRDEAI